MRDKYTEIRSDLTYYAGIDDLRGKTDEQKIDWFRKRFLKIVINPLEEVKIVGQKNRKIRNLNLGVVTLICCAIEALSSFYSYLPPDERRRGYDRSTFIKFVEDFMHQRYKEHSRLDKKYSEILYDRFRCGLAHGMTIEGHEVATRPEEYIRDSDGYISIDLWTLLEDLKSAFEKYLAQAEADGEERRKFLARFDEIFIKPYPSISEQSLVGQFSSRGTS